MSAYFLNRRPLWLFIAMAAYSFSFVGCGEKEVNIGPQLFEDGKLEECVAWYEGWLANPKLKSAGIEEANYYLGRVAFLENDYLLSAKYLGESLGFMMLNEDHDKEMFTAVHLLKGQAHGLIAQLGLGPVAPHIAGAKLHFFQALKSDPQSMGARQGLMIYYMEVPAAFGGDQELGKKYAAEIMEMDEANGYAANGYIKYKGRRYKGAEADILKGIEMGLNDAQTHTSLGRVYADWKKPEKAAEEFNLALELEPGYLPAKSGLEGLEKARRRAEARAATAAAKEEALKTRPKGSLKSLLGGTTPEAEESAAEAAPE